MQIQPEEGLSVPGFVFEFSTAINHGANLFGNPLAAGDHAFSPSSFATKLFSVGVVLEGYHGISQLNANNNSAQTTGSSSPTTPSFAFLDSKGLSATPYVYLIPVGEDIMRSPPLADTSTLRSWRVNDVTIPLPFNLGESQFSDTGLWQSSDLLSEDFFSIRKHQAFRAVDSELAFDHLGQLVPTGYTNSRLIGRSVWNNKWKLVIPGYSLLADPDEGMSRFIDTVKDVKLHFVTYSYSGN